MADVWLISGIPGAGKTTTARLLAERCQRSVVIEGDLFQGWIVSGNVWPGQAPAEESARQIRLNMENQCLLARSYAEAGFVPIIDYVIVSEADLGVYRQRLAGLSLYLVVLHPGRQVVIAREATREKSQRHKQKHGLTIGEQFAYLEEPLVKQLAGLGLWMNTATLTPAETTDAILAHRDRARLA